MAKTMTKIANDGIFCLFSPPYRHQNIYKNIFIEYNTLFMNNINQAYLKNLIAQCQKKWIQKQNRNVPKVNENPWALIVLP